MVIPQLKKRKVSKKLKSSWRKHVNINDVEDFLEEKRLEERLGPPLSTVPDEELFKVDSQPSTEYISKKQRRKLDAVKPLKCFSALQSYTNVPDPVTKRNRVRTKEERVSKFVKKKAEIDAKKGIVKAKTRQAIANRELDNLRRKQKPNKRGEFTNDVWEGDDNGKQDSWVEKNTIKHNLRGVGVPVKKVLRVKTDKNIIPAIEVPHPGMSYNPSFESHTDLLRKVAEKEIKLIKEEKHLDRVTRGMFSKVTEDKRDQDWLTDMSEGLANKDKPPSEDSDSDSEFKSINPPVKNVKKTLKQKRKKKEEIALQKARKALKMEKKKITDIHKIKVLVENVKKLEDKQAKLREVQKKNKALKKDKPKMLNAMKYEEPDLEFNLGQEITGNLKDLKTEGNILADRFKSMQKRNILAPTKKQTRKKAKVKKYTKPGHKDEDWKKTVARESKS